ncbi:Prophage tail length tape measure protein [compost metagenome]
MALKSRLELEVDGRSAEQQVNDIRAALEALEQAGVRASSTLRKSGGDYSNLAMSLAKVQAANDKAVSSNDAATKSAEAAAKAAASQRKELDSLLGKIDPLTKKLNDLAAQEAALAQARDSGQINSAAYDAYSRKLQESLNSLAGVSNAQKVVGETAEQARTRILAIADASVKAAQEQRNLASVATGLSEAEQGLLSGNMVLAANQGRLAESTQKVAAANRQAEVATEAQTESLNDLLAAIDPTTRALNRLDEQERKLAQQKKIGALDADTFAQYQGKIDQARAALTGFDDGLNRTGNTARQNAAALRMLPAQFSDIFISLQGGQAPLTVFLQQGSQIKDSFGGIGAAAKAMGGYVLGLVNPFTLAAAAATALGVAYYQGSKEQDEFRKALVITGNAAGTTTTELATMAERVGSVTGTTGGAAAALAQIAATGKIAIDRFEEIAVAVVSFEKATGKAVSETVAEFARLADDPVRAVVDLNDKYNFLTASVFEQIKAAKEQGDNDAAAAIAQEALAKAFTERSATIKENLGTLERAWNDVAGAAKAGWDAILDIGRESNQGPDVKAIQQKINYLKSNLDTGYEGLNDRKQIAALQAELDAYEKKTKAEQESARAAAETAKIQREGQIAYEQHQKNIEQNFTKQQKMNKALEDEQKRINAARAAGYVITKQEEEAALKAIRNNPTYKDSSTTKPAKEDAGQRMLDEARQRYAVLQQQSRVIAGEVEQTQRLGTEAKKLIELETEIASLKENKTLTTSQKQVLAMAELNLAQQKQNAELEKANELVKQRFENEAKLKAFTENLQSQLELSREGQVTELAGAGQSDRLRARLQEDLKIRQDYQKQLDKLTRDYNKIDNPTANDTDLYKGETDALRAALATRMVDQQNYYTAQDTMRGEWLTGVSESWQNYVDIATNYNEQARAATDSILGDTTSSISSSIQGMIKGTESLGDAFGNLAGDIANSMLTAFADITARFLVMQALKAAGITAETGLVVKSEAVKAGAKVAADGVAEASTLSTIATTLAANTAAAIETLASWAPAALVASIGSFGAAAVVGGTALIAAYALIKGMSGGFAEGGYTGPGGKYDPAGVVHKGEIVWSQADIRRFGGVSAVEGLRTGNVTPRTSAKSYSGSSSVGKSSGAQANQVIHQVTIENYSQSQVQTSTDPDGRLRVLVQAVKEQIADELSSGYGPVVDAGEAAYGWKRNPY